jgi:hypothetical protein
LSQRVRTKTKKRKPVTYLWIFGSAILVFLLIYFEQTALLYIFSTLGVTVLLAIVALADLGQSELPPGETDQGPPVATAKSAK